jgi:DNA-binding GntR family transcriptional regulator
MRRTVVHHAYYVCRRVGLAGLVRQALIEGEQRVGTLVERFTDVPLESSVTELQELMAAEQTRADAIDTAFEYRGLGAYRSIELSSNRPNSVVS